MKWLKIVLLCVALSSVSCLTVSEINTKIIMKENSSPTEIIIDYCDFTSTEGKMEDVHKDFNELINDWKGDQYLLDQAEEGIFIKSRDLYIRDDKIMGRVTGIVENLDKLYSFWVKNGERIMMPEDDEDFQIIETNGQIIKTPKNSLIVWPEDAKELWWKQRLVTESESFDKNRPVMVKMLKEYLAENKEKH